MSRRPKGPQPEQSSNLQIACQELRAHPAFRRLMRDPIAGGPKSMDLAPHDFAVVTAAGALYINTQRRLEVPQWKWVIAHALLHLGFGHARCADQPRPADPDPVDVAVSCVEVNRFLDGLNVGQAPILLPPMPLDDGKALQKRWRRDGLPEEYQGIGTTRRGPDFLPAHCVRHHGHTPSWEHVFAGGLAEAVTAAVDAAAGDIGPQRRKRQAWDRALSWFVSSYPLLGAVASGMRLVSDPDVARAADITVAAVDADLGELYINPHANLDEHEWRFVMAHEMLHAALRHHDRIGTRDHYLFNVACDYVINGWLVQMQVGSMPATALHDPTLAGLSAEEVYDRIATDLRRLRRLATLRGKGKTDILWDRLPGRTHAGTTLDDFYRRALITGLDYHRLGARGLLPAGLVEEIKALEHPPLPWDAKLAAWFEEFVPAAQPIRTYARASRRQAASPDIPRPGRYLPNEIDIRGTFGVILDTSASMDRQLLGKALGAIGSYAASRDVTAARVIYCDAAPYDAGYLSPDDLAGRVRLEGRGGTALQPAINLLQRAVDFPAAAPVLIITDGWCEPLQVRREHAYLVPAGARLPFAPRGPVFVFK
ncbi:Uncharacterized protein conserved in bacteria [Mycobacteroides abscessus subsp. abscessus]|uniref:vWA domain-containing protein n=1 Tax=Mycobacteroides abscessus TaxID=36809 RepID=UPI0009281D7F|nr:hypothetical protein [Mycobacteroides abscessus]SIH36739.1 Uncharacterized protein conserved in bacteria [Mycobacteroides abscessus subsp. abscessus]